MEPDHNTKALLRALEAGGYDAAPARHWETRECGGDPRTCSCWLGMTIPPIGMTVFRCGTGKPDWVAQVRIGDEQHVLVWGSNKERYRPGHHVWNRYLGVDNSSRFP